MKTPDEIKKGLECCTHNNCNDCPYRDKRVGCRPYRNDDALALIWQLEAKVPRWISVEERLPNIDEEVLICTKEGLYDVAQYTGADRFWTLERNPSVWVTAMGVTHWMPLPEPPKE